MVRAEKNVNPFVSQAVTVCNDPTLPENELLRGFTPLVDPDFDQAELANDLAATTLNAPLDATGKSIADLLAEAGFTNLIGQGVDGATEDLSGGPVAGGDVADTAVDTATAVETATAVDTATAIDTAIAVVTDGCAALVAQGESFSTSSNSILTLYSSRKCISCCRYDCCGDRHCCRHSHCCCRHND
jgi:hypothetical protein